MPDATEAQRRSRLARFGLGVNNAETRAGDLSGGEKARLLFSLISFNAPHLLVLDEPANHLDMDTRAELIKSLNDYPGAILIISHDRNLLESVVDRLWLVENGTIKTYEGSLEDYRNQQVEKERLSKKTEIDPEKRKSFARKEAALARKRIAPLKAAYQKIETAIDHTNKKMSELDIQLAEKDLFTMFPEKAVKLGQNRVHLAKKLGELEDRGLLALETYEAAKKKKVSNRDWGATASFDYRCGYLMLRFRRINDGVALWHISMTAWLIEKFGSPLTPPVPQTHQLRNPATFKMLGRIGIPHAIRVGAGRI